MPIMSKPGFIIRDGFPAALRRQAAEIYFQAFEGKIGGILGRDGRGLAFVERVIDPRFAICAVSADGTRLLGIAGFKTTGGAMVGGTMSDLAAIYGWFGACWRAALLSVLERGLANGQLLMDGIAVAAEARGMGIGSALLDAIVDEAEKRGMKEVRLDVIDSNPRAKSLYERKGFIAGGRLSTGPFRRLFGFSFATTMARPLTPHQG
ncbi:MAG: GNAT family N-acetyltransferase [Rhizobiaceae bacterium]|nr:GNAT family N-acetyltransferase [Rhizobiaceae bacterium]